MLRRVIDKLRKQQPSPAPKPQPLPPSSEIDPPQIFAPKQTWPVDVSDDGRFLRLGMKDEAGRDLFVMLDPTTSIFLSEELERGAKIARERQGASAGDSGKTELFAVVARQPTTITITSGLMDESLVVVGFDRGLPPELSVALHRELAQRFAHGLAEFLARPSPAPRTLQ